ncbi:hypothetical protein H8N01_18325 [Streptomyces sp. AC536]|uniref:hypothetical protein n=1 Tax=Streptomyces buecherae TaxID=2763006 RepID=UPI00164EAC18|nr:hypothetical protein [Streptomyces buecherae]QNJ38713.1 hypothetical protein H7H31_01390 [Streptomyces buecherae]
MELHAYTRPEDAGRPARQAESLGASHRVYPDPRRARVLDARYESTPHPRAWW